MKIKHKKLSIAGKVRIKASGKQPKAQILGYTGGKLHLEGWNYPVVVDLPSLKARKERTPILKDHDPTKDMGYFTEFSVDDNKLWIEGPLDPSKPATQEFLKDSKVHKIEFEASIGIYDPSTFQTSFVKAGNVKHVNGQDIEGPFYYVKNALLDEITICLFGADRNTKAIAAKRTSQPRKVNDMSFKAFIEKKGLDPAKITASQKKSLRAAYDRIVAKNKAKKEAIVASKPTPSPKKIKKVVNKPIAASAVFDLDAFREQQIDELERTDKIRQLFNDYSEVEEVSVDGKKNPITASDFRRMALKSDMTPDQVELALIRASRGNPSTNPGIQVVDRKLESEAVVAAICKTHGMPENDVNKFTGKKSGYANMFSEKVLDASDQRQYQDVSQSISSLLDLQIRAAGKMYTGFNRNSSDFFGLAHEAWTECQNRSIRASGFSSSLSITNIFENVMNKTMLDSFQRAEGIWAEFCGVMSLKDFRAANMYQLDLTGTYKKIANDGEIKHVGMTDRKKTISIETYGAMIAIDRKTMIDDDMGQVVNKARSIAVLAAERLEELVFVTLLGNAGSFYSSGNGNLISGGGSALSLSALETARLSFRNQVINNKPIRVAPDRILVPPQLEQLANRIYNEERMQWVGGNTTNSREFTNNEFARKYRVLVSPYLSNTAILDQDGGAISGQSSTAWYLFCDPNMPQGAAMNVGFLNGRRVPYFDQADTQFNIPSGIQFRSYHDFGAAFCQERVTLKSAGA